LTDAEGDASTAGFDASDVPAAIRPASLPLPPDPGGASAATTLSLRREKPVTSSGASAATTSTATVQRTARPARVLLAGCGTTGRRSGLISVGRQGTNWPVAPQATQRPECRVRSV